MFVPTVVATSDNVTWAAVSLTVAGGLGWLCRWFYNRGKSVDGIRERDAAASVTRDGTLIDDMRQQIKDAAALQQQGMLDMKGEIGALKQQNKMQQEAMDKQEVELVTVRTELAEYKGRHAEADRMRGTAEHRVTELLAMMAMQEEEQRVLRHQLTQSVSQANLIIGLYRRESGQKEYDTFDPRDPVLERAHAAPVT